MSTEQVDSNIPTESASFPSETGLEEEEQVKVVNRITGAKKNVKMSEISLFLKKHTLFEVVPDVPSATPPKRARARGGRPPKKTSGPIKPEEKAQTGKRGSSDAALSALPVEPLILTLTEAQTIFDAYTAAAGSVSDWDVFAAQVCDGKFPPSDVRLVAEEFQPAVHFRPASGMVVIDRHSLGSAEAKRRRIDEAAVKVEEIRKAALAGVQAADFSKARALGISRTPGMAASSTAPPSGAALACSVSGGAGPGTVAPSGAGRGSAEVEFVRDVLQAAQEWIQVIPTVATRESMTMLLIRAAQGTLGQ